jgi:hypothetical protein
MDSGTKVIVVNPQERAVSSDANRLQAFGAASLAEALRYLLDVPYGTDDVQASSGAQTSEVVTDTSPLTGEVVGGLCVVPQLASLNLLVTAGLLYAVDPGSSPSADDSVYKYVKDPGVQTLGNLAMTANSSGSIRIDVIEVQRQTTVTESDPRDTFNATTGIFTTSTLPKVTNSSLVYRVRAGTAGAGFPGTASGWLPLAVASVASGATTCDQMTFWDVRPLLSDRWPSVQNVSTARVRRLETIASGSVATAFGGHFDMVLSGRRVGGKLRRGTPGTDATSIDITAVANQDPAVASASNGMFWYLWLCCPFGLPRWARYTDPVSGSRVPRNPRGIPVVSLAPPNVDGSLGLNAVTLPTSLGFGTVTPSAGQLCCVGAGLVNSTPSVTGYYSGGGGTDYPVVGAPTATGVVTGSSVAFNLIGQTHFPPQAREVLVQVNLSTIAYTSAAAVSAVSARISAPGGSPLLFGYNENITPTSGGTDSRVLEFWMPLETPEPSSLAASNYDLTVTLTNVASIASATAGVAAWRY